jgi:hypothetical protein
MLIAKEKAEELHEVFMNDNTRDSERKAFEHAIFHVEEILSLVRDKDIVEYYTQVLTHLNAEI